MQKELVIATTPQETKIAILEDDELVEYYIERHRSQGIVGNIYKGKVTKVLPGMQSAFVDIGLERDAFLYVSDFFEDTEEYEKIVSTVEDEVAQLQQEGARGRPSQPPVAPAAAATATPVTVSTPSEPTEEPPAVVSTIQPLPGEVLSEERPPAGTSPVSAGPSDDYERRGGRGRRDRDRGDRDRDRDRDRRGKKPKIPSFESKSYEPRSDDRPYGTLAALPGESLAKLSRRPDASPETEDPDARLGAVAEEAPPAPASEAEQDSTRPVADESRSAEKKESAETEERTTIPGVSGVGSQESSTGKDI